jgi:hypothetical protein
MSKRLAAFAVLALLTAGAAPLAQAHGGEWGHGGGWGHGGPRWSIGLNLGFPGYYSGYAPGYFPAYSPSYYPAPYYAPQSVVYVAQPVAEPPSQVVYQYYCPNSAAYYPAVPTCTQPWLKVVPDGSVHN